MENSGARFDAFISYSHAADGGLAPALQHALQVFAKPWYVRRALRLFRDQTILTATPTLWPNIEGALSESRYFILLASPGAAGSTWVQREVEWWLAHRTPETLMIALTKGRLAWSEPAKDFDWQQTDALPPALKGVLSTEPLWVDLRTATSEGLFSPKAPAFQDAVASLAAPLRNCPKDDLIGEDVRQHHRALRLARGAVASLVGLVIALAVAALVALNQRNTAISQQRLATSRQLAAQAVTRLPTQLDLALLLAHQAFMTRDTLEARSALLSAQQFSPYLKAFLHGQVTAVDAVVFSPNGSVLAGAGSDGSVQLWDMATLQPFGLRLTTGMRKTNEADVASDVRNGVAFSPDGKLLASAGADNALRLWDMNTRELAVPPLTGHQSIVGTRAFSHDGALLASGSWDRTVRLWDPRTGQPSGEPLEAAEMPVTGLAFSPDDYLLVVASIDGGVTVWDVATRTLMGIVAKPESFSVGSTRSIAFSPDGHLLITTNGTGDIELWDVQKHRELRSPLTGHNGAVLSIAFNANGTRLVSAGQDHTVRQWDMNSMGALGAPMMGHSDVVKSVAFSPDGRTIASSSVDGSVRLWDAEQNPPLSTTLTGHTSLVTSTTFSPDGRIIASASHDQSIRVWDVSNRCLIATLNGHTGIVNTLSFRSQDRLLASGGEDGTVRFWDVVALQEVGRIETGHAAGVKSIAFSPDGTMLVTGGRDAFVESAPRPGVSVSQAVGTIRMWDVATGTAIGEPLERPMSIVKTVVFSRDGKILASSSDKTVLLWDVASRQPLGAPLTGHTDDVMSLSFSPDGKLLASGSNDGTVRLWDVDQGTNIASLAATSQVHSVAFSPDGALLASAGLDRTLRLWDVAHREPFASPIRGGGASVAFAPNGRLLVSGSDNLVRIWDIAVDSWLTRTCMLANRDLSKSEWGQFVGDAPYERTCLPRR
jgi:FOG: WD40 repeat